MSDSSEPIDPGKLLTDAGESPERVAVALRNLELMDPVAKAADLQALFLRSEGTVIKVRSKRLKNCLLNWKGLLIDLGLTIGGAWKGDPISIVLAAGRILKILSDKASVQLGDQEAKAVVALWRDPREGEAIPDSALRASLKVTEDDFDRIVLRLLDLGIISRRDPDGHIVRTERLYLE